MLAAGCAVFGFCFTICVPRNRVEAHFRNVPAGTENIGVVVDENGSIDNLPGYILRIGQPVAILADWPWRDEQDSKTIGWRQGDRYGVVTQNKAGAWTVTWFDAAAVPVEGRSRLFAGGTVELDLAKGRAELLPREQAEKLGLSVEP